MVEPSAHSPRCRSLPPRVVSLDLVMLMVDWRRSASARTADTPPLHASRCQAVVTSIKYNLQEWLNQQKPVLLPATLVTFRPRSKLRPCAMPSVCRGT